MKQASANAALYILFIMLALVTYGWHYGWHNHAALIPAIYHMMDPSVLANDMQAGDFPVYIRALTWLIAQMAYVVPLPILFLGFQVLSLFLLFYALRKFTDLILPGEPHFGWLTVLVIIVYRYFIPGENLIIGSWILFESTFYMYTLGYAVSLLALVYLARGRVVWAGILAGLALYIQLNHGEQVVLLLAGTMLLKEQSFVEKAKQIGLFALISSVVGLPILIAAFADQVLPMLHAQPASVMGPTFYDVLRFRHRHHLQPTAWPAIHHIMFVLQIIGTATLFHLRRRVTWQEVDRVFSRTFVVIVFLCGLGYLNELLRIEVIDKSYLFRTSVIAAIITVTYSCWAIWHFVLKRFAMVSRSQFWRVGALLLSVYTLCAFIISYTHPELFTGWRSKIFPGLTFDLQMTPLEQYIKDRTPVDAVFLVAPDYLNFAVNTRRAEVVNWMAIPFNKDNFRLWYQRIVDITDHRVTIETMRTINDSYAIRDSSGAAYYRLPPEKVLEVAKKYKATYCVFTSNLPIKPEFQWENLAVYKLQ